jgi:FkbM family methyltransferase
VNAAAEAKRQQRFTRSNGVQIIMSCRQLLTKTHKKFEHLYFSMDYFDITFDGGSLNFVDTNRLSRKRVDTLFTKEPTTILWMDQFKPGEVMFDVGGNVGMYSVYAAKVRGARVFSFEPESQNYAELNRNIFLNQLNGKVTAYNLAVSNRFELSTLFLSHFCPGFSHHDFGENRWDKDMDIGVAVLKRDDRLEQGCTSIVLDEVIDQGYFPQPQHIKVDVDGFEWKVVDGARKTLQSPELKTVLIETDNKIADSVAIIETMTSMGWKFSYDQMRVDQHEVISEEEVKRRIADGKGGQNIVYFKDDGYFDLFRNYAENFVAPNPHKKAKVDA